MNRNKHKKNLVKRTKRNNKRKAHRLAEDNFRTYQVNRVLPVKSISRASVAIPDVKLDKAMEVLGK